MRSLLSFGCSTEEGLPGPSGHRHVVPDATYANPVHPGYFADPFVLRLPDGTYAAYGTGRIVGGRAFEVLRSTDLRTWTSVGGALEPLGTDDAQDYWAPEVAYSDGRYFMYYSAGAGDKGHLLRVAVADAP